MKKYKYLKLDLKENIAHITISRPRQNRINIALWRELNTVLAKLASQQQDLLGVIISGASQFSGGHDIPELLRLNYSNAKKYSSLGQDTLLWLSRIDRPVIAAIDGAAIGPGLDLALACDYRLATNDAYFQHPEMSMGITPCFGGSVRLQRIVGQRAAAELVNSSKRLSAAEAHCLGIVDSLVDSTSMLFEAEQLIKSQAIQKDTYTRDDFTEEREAFARCFKDEDVKRLIRRSH